MIGIPVVLLWLTMTASLLRNELGVQNLSRSAPGETEPGESWLGIYATEGHRVGHVHILQAPEERRGEAGFRTGLEARMELVMLGKPTDLDLEGSVWRPREASRVEFDFNVRSAGFDFAVAGDVADGWLNGEVASAGEILPLRLPVDTSVLITGGMGSALQFPVLEVGEEYRIDSFDPITLSPGKARVRCIARETLTLGGAEIATRHLTVAMNGLESEAWIDDRGDVVRARTPVGLTLERITADDVEVAASGTEGSPGLLESTAIQPAGLRPFRGARTMTVRLRGVDDLSLPEDRVQSAVEPHVYRIAMPAEPDARESTISGPALDPHLRSDTFVQSEHPSIRKQALEIVGNASGTWEKSLAIHEWVFSRLDKEAVLSIPSALEVLKRRRGDCNEHTVLFTALARAAGVPARIAIGIVWSDELEGFYYHAWPEIFLDDWIWMDPTLGQPMADATHLKLASGGIETWPRLLPFLGRLEIEVLTLE